MNDEITLFGKQLTVNDLNALVLWSLNKFIGLREKVQMRCSMTKGDIVNESILLILKQNENPKWANPQCSPSTAIVNCVRYCLLNLLKSKRISYMTSVVNADNDSVLNDMPTYDKEYNGDEVTFLARVNEILPEQFARVISLRYGGDRILTFKEVARKLDLTRSRVHQINSAAIEILINSELLK